MVVDASEPGRTTFRDLPLGEFVSHLASSEPVPGGGSAAAVAASLGAALVSMVASLSIDRPRFAQHAETLQRARGTGDELADRFLRLADDDAAAFAAYAAALKLPRSTAEEQQQRAAAVASAARGAAEVPRDCVEACLELASAAESIAGRSNPNASSDLSVAALLANAAAQAAAANVLVNLPAVSDQTWADHVQAHVLEVLAGVRELAQRTRETVATGEQRAPGPGEVG